jgi:protein subunit release factor A
MVWAPLAKRSGAARVARGPIPLLPAMSRHEAVIVEIRAAEGGADAKDLVVDQTKIYLRLIGRRSL